MRKRFLTILISVGLALCLTKANVLAAGGGFGLTSSTTSLNPGQIATVTIIPDNSVGKLVITSSNPAVATVETSSVFIEWPNVGKDFTVTAQAVGTTTITVATALDNYATMDERVLNGYSQTLTIQVVAATTDTPGSTTVDEIGATETETPKPSTALVTQTTGGRSQTTTSTDSANDTGAVEDTAQEIVTEQEEAADSTNTNATTQDSATKESAEGVPVGLIVSIVVGAVVVGCGAGIWHVRRQ